MSASTLPPSPLRTTPDNAVNLCCGADNDCPDRKHKSCTTVKSADKIAASLKGLVQFDTRPTSRYPVDWENVRPFCPLTREEADLKERWTCPDTSLIEAWIKAATSNIMIWLCGKLGIDSIFIAVGGVTKGIDRVVAKLDKSGIKVLVGPLCHAQFLENGLTPRAADDARTLNDALAKYSDETPDVQQKTTFNEAVDIEWLEERCARIAEKMKAGRERYAAMKAILDIPEGKRSLEQNKALDDYNAQKVRIVTLRAKLKSGKELTPAEHEKLAAADRLNEERREQRAKDRAEYERIDAMPEEKRSGKEQAWLDTYEARRETANEYLRDWRTKKRAEFERIDAKPEGKRLPAEQTRLDAYEAKREQKNEEKAKWQRDKYAAERAGYKQIDAMPEEERLEAARQAREAEEKRDARAKERKRLKALRQKVAERQRQAALQRQAAAKPAVGAKSSVVIDAPPSLREARDAALKRSGASFCVDAQPGGLGLTVHKRRAMEMAEKQRKAEAKEAVLVKIVVPDIGSIGATLERLVQNDGEPGARIKAVERESQAEAAGLLPGDVPVDGEGRQISHKDFCMICKYGARPLAFFVQRTVPAMS